MLYIDPAATYLVGNGLRMLQAGPRHAGSAVTVRISSTKRPVLALVQQSWGRSGYLMQIVKRVMCKMRCKCNFGENTPHDPHICHARHPIPHVTTSSWWSQSHPAKTGLRMNKLRYKFGDVSCNICKLSDWCKNLVRVYWSVMHFTLNRGRGGGASIMLNV